MVDQCDFEKEYVLEAGLCIYDYTYKSENAHILTDVVQFRG